MAIGLSLRGRSAACDAIVNLVDEGTLNSNGYIGIFTAPRPTTPEVPVNNSVRLVTIPLSSPAFGTASNGIATALGLTTSGITVDNSGTASWFRVFDKDNNPIWDGAITLTDGGGDMQLNDLSFLSGGKIVITTFRAVMPL